MLKPARFAAVLILGSMVAAVSCVADVSDDSEGATEEAVREKGAITAGLCAEACDAVADGDCDWQGQCSEDDAFHLAYCGQRFLTCDEAENAANGDLYGRTYCFRGCENLH
jgi:hypothetical protein